MSFELQEKIDFVESCEISRKIGIVLDPARSGVATPCITPFLELSLDPITPQPSTMECHIDSNPLIKLSFLSDEEREEMNQIIQDAEYLQNPVVHLTLVDNFYVPILPFKCIELELASINNTMWQIPSVKHPPPISIGVWALWSGLTATDLEGCRQCAIDGTFLSKLHVMGTTWSMTWFSMPCSSKYKCQKPSNVQIKIHGLPTDDSKHENRTAML